MRRRTPLLVSALVVACAWPAGLAVADPTAVTSPDPSPAASSSATNPATATPTPTGTPTAAPSATPSDSPSPSADPSSSESADPTPTTPSTTPTPSSSPSTVVPRRAASTAGLSLRVGAGDTPQAGRFFEDIGYYAFAGAVDAGKSGQRVEIWRYGADKKWHKVAATTTDDDETYAARLNVTDRGTQRFRSTLGGNPTASGVTSSADVTVTVRDAYVTMKAPPTKIDSLRSITISGAVAPARAGVPVRLQVRVGKDLTYRTTGPWVTTKADGSYAFTYSAGKGELKKYGVRTIYLVANRHRYEIAPSQPVTRIKVLNAVVTKTTAAEVAKTYRSGCPVGPSKLRTVTMNFYGFDKKMHRGVLIVRTDLTGEIIRSFQRGLDASYPIRKMNNPNVYGGNDPKQMAADNTSGFNCRKVVGNPYAQSPHSYGIAIDVNTVENPYRDANGKWWPANGKKYIDRSPLKTGMLSTGSTLTKRLRHEGYFWGGLWSPGRDYQHFQYDK